MSKRQLKQWKRSRAAAEKAFRIMSESSEKPIVTSTSLKDEINNIPGLEILGSGAYGIVVSTPPLKNGNQSAIKLSSKPRTIENIKFEIDSSALAGDSGIGPRILMSNINPVKSNRPSNRANSSIEMEYLDPDRYEELSAMNMRQARGLSTEAEDITIRDANSYTSAQTAYLAKKGYRVQDRHGGNIFIDKESGLPIQVDFGIGERLGNEWDRLVEAKSIIEDRLRINGQSDESIIFSGIVDEHLKSGNIKEASELIDQGIEILSNYLPSQVQGVRGVEPILTSNNFRGLRPNRVIKNSDSPELILLGDSSSPRWTDAAGASSQELYNQVKEIENGGGGGITRTTSSNKFIRNPNFVNSEIPF